MAKRIVKAKASNSNNRDETSPTLPQPVAEARDQKPARRAKKVSSLPTDEDVRLRAYFRYLERGGSPGEPLTDWVEAERELRPR
jgi:hypothetical protein